jgi:hypothetical protein
MLRTPVALPPILEWMEQRMPELRRSPQTTSLKARVAAAPPEVVCPACDGTGFQKITLLKDQRTKFRPGPRSEHNPELTLGSTVVATKAG